MLAVVAAVGIAAALPQERMPCPSREFSLSFACPDEKVVHKTLWASRDGGKTWRTARDAGVAETWGEWKGGKIRVTLRLPEDGPWDFYAQVGDEVSNRTEEPRPGQTEDVVRLDVSGAAAPLPAAGTLAWEEPRAGGAWTGGQTVTLRWSAPPGAFLERTAELHYAVEDGPWTLVTRGLEPQGSYAWVVPNRETPRLRLRIRAVARTGQEASAESAAMGVRASSARPEIARARALYDRARVLHAQGRTAEAQLKYEEALAAWPEFGEVYNDLGKLHFEARSHARALEYFIRARKACPSNPTPYVNAGRMELLLGLHAEAVADLRDAVELGLERDERTAVLAGETLWAVARAATLAGDPARAREASELILRIRQADRATRARAEQALEWLKEKR
jgi:Tfp pilus assembly protein PilF